MPELGCGRAREKGWKKERKKERRKERRKARKGAVRVRDGEGKGGKRGRADEDEG